MESRIRCILNALWCNSVSLKLFVQKSMGSLGSWTWCLRRFNPVPQFGPASVCAGVERRGWRRHLFKPKCTYFFQSTRQLMPFVFFYTNSCCNRRGLSCGLADGHVSVLNIKTTRLSKETSQVLFYISGCYSNREETYGQRKSCSPAPEELLGCAWWFRIRGCERGCGETDPALRITHQAKTICQTLLETQKYPSYGNQTKYVRFIYLRDV